MDEPFSGLIEAFGNDTWPADFLIGLFMLAFVIAAYLESRWAEAIKPGRNPKK